MNKQEVIEEIKNLEGLTILDKTINFDSEMIPKKEVLNIVKQLSEPVKPPEPEPEPWKSEKPVVPQFVADWYEENKDDFNYSLYDLCFKYTERKLNVDLHKWFRYDDNKPFETFVMMHKFGYEVEKEKLYQVELPGSHKHGDIILVKDDDGDITYDVVFSDKWKERDYTKLTESEIKQDFEWAWQFAEEV